MKKDTKSIVITILIIVSIITMFFVSKLFINNGVEKLAKEKNNINRKQFAIYVNEGDSYKEYEGNEWPDNNYRYKEAKCVDNSGNETNKVITFDELTRKVTLKTAKTVYCTLYFDKIFVGEGSKDNPFKIKNIENLMDLQVEVNKGRTYDGEYFELENDLDFNNPSDYQDYQSKDYGDINGNGTDDELKTELTTGSGWIPIGNLSTIYFKGIFDGKDHEIKNLYINNTKTSVNVIGLFGSIEKSTIKNLIVTGDIKTSLINNTGILVGDALNATIENCTTKGTVTSTAGDWSTGGIIGAVFDQVTIKNSHNEAAVTGGAWIGGLVGGFGSGTLRIEGSNNLGTVSKIDDGTIYGLGGLVGAAVAANEDYSIIIDTSYNAGEIIDKPVKDRTVSYTGGLIGNSIVDVTINNSSNRGNITVFGENALDAFVGGLIGRDNINTQTINITDSYNSGTIDVNFPRNVLLGGLMGHSYGNLNVSDSYNSGKIINSKAKYETGYGSDIGGLVGACSNADTVMKIENSYNNAPLNNATDMGGIVGAITSKQVIINSSYNTGSIECNNVNPAPISYGGILGGGYGANVSIINSHNEGSITCASGYGDYFLGGITGIATYGGGTYIVINSYNIGNVTSGKYATGIILIHSIDAKTLIANNVYNFGTIVGVTGGTYELFNYYTNTIVDIKNSYYRNNISKEASSFSNAGIIGKSDIEMQTQTFVDNLNNNVNNIVLENISPNLKGYTLTSWKLNNNVPSFNK